LEPEVFLDIWKAMHPHLEGGDLQSAADDFLHVMIEHGVDAGDIKEFVMDEHLKKSLLDFLADEDVAEYVDEHEFDAVGDEDNDEYDYA